MRAALLGALQLLSAAVAATAAAEPVRTRTSTGTPVEWRRACPMLRLEAGGHPDYPNERLRAAIEAGFAAWTQDGCSGLPVDVADATTSTRDIGFDGRSIVVWRHPGYCDDPEHAAAETCLSPSAAAVTTIFYYDLPGEARDGELIEADIEINAERFAFADDGNPARLDLPSVMTHELGHALGLDHSCNPLAGAFMIDAAGAPVTPCFPLAGLPEPLVSATMFPYTSAGETSRRNPRPEERQLVCAIYASHSGECQTITPGCGCRAGGRAPGGLALLAAAATALMAFRARRPH